MKKRQYEAAAMEAVKEAVRAGVAHGPFRSAHEGFSILNEEVDELWDEVKRKNKKRSKKALRAEALQVAAMAIRFMVDIVDEGRVRL